MLERLRGQGGQGIEVRDGLPIRVQGLDAHMASPGVEMVLQALPDGRLIPPGHHGIQKPLAPTLRQVLLAEPQAGGRRW